MPIARPLAAAAIASSLASACAAPTPVAPVVAAPIPADAAASAGIQVQPSPALRQRADELVMFINGRVEPAQIFSPAVLSKLSGERLKAIAAAVRAKYGNALAVDRIEATTPVRGRVFITFEKSQASFKLGMQPAPPNLINELLFA